MDISVVIPLLNEEDSLTELHDWIAKVMQSNRYSYEILFIDDGSTDNSWKVIDKIRSCVLQIFRGQRATKTTAHDT